jgi:hypothetical protein
VTVFSIPLRLNVSLNSRMHWAKRAKIVRAQRAAVALSWSRWGMKGKATEPSVVTLSRIAPRRVDDDNLRGLLKGVRDEVATQLGVDDGGKLVKWRYEDRKGAVREHAVQIRVETQYEWYAREVSLQIVSDASDAIERALYVKTDHAPARIIALRGHSAAKRRGRI